MFKYTHPPYPAHNTHTHKHIHTNTQVEFSFNIKKGNKQRFNGQFLTF